MWIVMQKILVNLLTNLANDTNFSTHMQNNCIRHWLTDTFYKIYWVKWAITPKTIENTQL